MMNITLPSIENIRRNNFQFFYNYTQCTQPYDTILYTITPIIRNKTQRAKRLAVKCAQILSAPALMFNQIIDSDSVRSHSYTLYVPVSYTYLYLYNITSMDIQLVRQQFGDAVYNYYGGLAPSCQIKLMRDEASVERMINCEFPYLTPGYYTIKIAVEMSKNDSTSSIEYGSIDAQVNDEYYFDYVSDDNITITASQPHGLNITFPVAPAHFNLGDKYTIVIQDSKKVTIRQIEYETKSMNHTWTYNTEIVHKLSDYALENLSVTIKPTKLPHCGNCSPAVTKYYMLPSQQDPLDLNNMIYIIISCLFAVLLLITAALLWVYRKRLKCQKNSTPIYIISDGGHNAAISELSKLLNRLGFPTKHCTLDQYNDMRCVENVSSMILCVRDPYQVVSKLSDNQDPSSLRSGGHFKYISFNNERSSKSEEYYTLPCDLHTMISHLRRMSGKSARLEDKALRYIKQSKKALASILTDLENCDIDENPTKPEKSFDGSDFTPLNLQTGSTYQEQTTYVLIERETHSTQPGIREVPSSIEDNDSVYSYNSSSDKQEDTNPSVSVRMSFNVQHLQPPESETEFTFSV